MVQPQRVAVRVAASATAEAPLECVAVAHGGERVFAGTSAGTLLVYARAGGGGGADGAGAGAATDATALQLVARRSLSRKPLEVRRHNRVSALHTYSAAALRRRLAQRRQTHSACTHDTDLSLTTRRPFACLQAVCLLAAARRLAVLVDGTVILLDAATLEGAPLAGARGATLIAAVRSRARPCAHASLPAPLRRVSERASLPLPLSILRRTAGRERARGWRWR
jgi:hypothetical protein